MTINLMRRWRKCLWVISIVLQSSSVANAQQDSVMLVGHKRLVSDVAISQKGDFAASREIGTDKTFIWSFPSGKKLHVIENGQRGIYYAMAFTPNGKELAILTSKGLFMHTLAQQGNLEIKSIPIKDANAIAFSDDGTLFAVNHDQDLVVYDRKTCTIRHTLSGPKLGISHILFSRDSGTVAATTRDQTLWQWQLGDPKNRSELKGDLSSVAFLATAPNPNSLISAGMGGQVMLWDLAKGRSTKLFKADHDISSVASSLNGKLLALGTLGGGTEIWNLDRNKRISILMSSYHVYSVAMSADGAYVLMSYGKNAIIDDKLGRVALLRLAVQQ